MSVQVASAGPLSEACAESLTHCYPKGYAKTHGPRCRRCSLWERQEDPQCLRPFIQAWNPTWGPRSPGWEAPRPSKVVDPVKEGKHSCGREQRVSIFPKPHTPAGQSCQLSIEKKRLLVCMLTWPGKSKAFQHLLHLPSTFTYSGCRGTAMIYLVYQERIK